MSGNESKLRVRSAPKSWEEFEQEVIQAQVPCLFKGALNEWPAMKKWSLSYMGENFPNHEVNVSTYVDQDELWIPQGRHPMKVSDYVKQTQTAPSAESKFCYLIQESFLPVPEMQRDILPLPWMDKLPYANPWGMTIGRDSYTDLHFHRWHESSLGQIKGSKDVIFYPPEDYALLAFHEMEDPARANHSPLRFDVHSEEELTKLRPELENAHPTRGRLDPGDLVYIPVHWHHAVLGREESVSVVRFWSASLEHWTFPEPGLRSLVSWLQSNTDALEPFVDQKLGTELMKIFTKFDIPAEKLTSWIPLATESPSGGVPEDVLKEYTEKGAAPDSPKES